MNEHTEEEREALRRLLRAIGLAFDEFVIVGGQASRLFRLHRLARSLSWDALLTRDIDVATMARGHRSLVDVAKALEREGFTTRLDGDDAPPLTKYVFGTAEVEFIVPDAPRRRPGGNTVLVLGASAQKVSDLEPLLVNPIELNVPGVGRVQTPNPAAYIIQKALTLTVRRTLAKKAKDALYIHDALQLFTQQGQLQNEVIEQAKLVYGSLNKKQRTKLSENIAKLSDARTDFVREAGAQAINRNASHSSEAIALVCRLGFSELLSSLVRPHL